ncbi:MAG TPA: selenocysteine-specific translation elongation factor [Gemmatimonadaceae bacterium]
MILGTAGHIDHGKTALVRALTGVDTDRLPEEKRRGITIDLGFAPLEIDGIGTIGIVDVPGHEAFIRTMLAGASGIDLAMLVVAADEGVMPQTREHLEILSLLGIRKGVIAITKSDLADDEWKSLVQDDIRTLTRDTFLSDAEIVFVSALTGSNVSELKDAIRRAASTVEGNRKDDLFRMPIDRAFTVRGTGTVVTGTVWSGSLERDRYARIEPGGKQFRVRAIQSHGHNVDTATPGTRTAVALASSEIEDAGRGANLISDPHWIPTTRIDVVLTLHENFSPTPRTRVRFHAATAETGARLSRLRALEDGTLSSRLVLDEPILARAQERFVIRLPSPPTTVGGGVIVDPYPSRMRKAPHREVSLEGRLAEILGEAGPMGVKRALLPIRTGYSETAVRNALGSVNAMEVGELVISPNAITLLEDRIIRLLAIETANHPLEDGVSLQTLRMAGKAPEQVIDFVFDRLIMKGSIEVSGSLARPAGWKSRLSVRDQEVSDAILHAICTQGAEPPTVGELQSKFGSATSALIRRLERQGDVKRVSEDRYYSAAAVEQMVGSLRAWADTGRRYSPSELKEVLGVSRKFLIPFLEFCDRTGVTERQGDGRVVRSAG